MSDAREEGSSEAGASEAGASEAGAGEAGASEAGASEERPTWKRVARAVVPLLIVGAAVAVVFLLVRTEPEPQRAKEEKQPTPVAVVQVDRHTADVEVRARGEVVPARRIVLSPQVSGEVVWVHDELVPGGLVEKGETVVRVDPSDYRLAVEAQRGQLRRAEVDLRRAQNQQEVARYEWERFGPDRPPESELTLHEPQVDAARAAVDAAESELRRARLQLRRTSIEAPFDATVQQEQVDLGQTVSPQSQVATLVGTDSFWVRVSVPVHALRALRIPRGDAEKGSPARVWQSTRGERIERDGHVLRLISELDERGNMARVLVEIEDPLGLEMADGGEEGSVPLLLGAFVEVALEAAPLDGVFEIPRVALRGEDRVWVVREDGTLDFREVEVAWERDDSVLVRGLSSGDRVIRTRLRTPVEGMELEVVEEPGPSLRYAEGAEGTP